MLCLLPHTSGVFTYLAWLYILLGATKEESEHKGWQKCHKVHMNPSTNYENAILGGKQWIIDMIIGAQLDI